MFRAPSSDVLIVGGGAARASGATTGAVSSTVRTGDVVHVSESDPNSSSMAVSGKGNSHDKENDKVHCEINW